MKQMLSDIEREAEVEAEVTTMAVGMVEIIIEVAMILVTRPIRMTRTVTIEVAIMTAMIEMESVVFPPQWTIIEAIFPIPEEMLRTKIGILLGNSSSRINSNSSSTVVLIITHRKISESSANEMTQEDIAQEEMKGTIPSPRLFHQFLRALLPEIRDLAQ